MNLEIVLGVLVLVALLVSTGIITVGASTFINNVALKAFEKKGQMTPIGPDYTYKGEDAKELQEDLRFFPSMLRKWYIMCHLPAFVLILFIVIYDAASDFKITEWHLYIDNYPYMLIIVLKGLPAITVFLIMGYIGFVIWHLLKFKSNLFTIIGRRFNQD